MLMSKLLFNISSLRTNWFKFKFINEPLHVCVWAEIICYCTAQYGDCTAEGNYSHCSWSSTWVWIDILYYVMTSSWPRFWKRGTFLHQKIVIGPWCAIWTTFCQRWVPGLRAVRNPARVRPPMCAPWPANSWGWMQAIYVISERNYTGMVILVHWCFIVTM